ncbi:hypothetical protein ACYZT4_26410 [Pseudomonas sp. GB2N2]
MKQIQRILAQGHFDGFCLIYALFNGYKALKNPEVKASDFALRNSNAWKKVIGSTPSLHNFVLGEGSNFGELKGSTDAKLKQRFVGTCMEALTDRVRYTASVSKVEISDLATTDFSESVVIICVTDKAKSENGKMGDHWVCIVGRDDDERKYLVACSFTHQRYGFTERQDEETKRFYNTTIAYKGLNRTTIYPDNINLISIIPA